MRARSRSECGHGSKQANVRTLRTSPAEITGRASSVETIGARPRELTEQVELSLDEDRPPGLPRLPHRARPPRHDGVRLDDPRGEFGSPPAGHVENEPTGGLVDAPHARHVPAQGVAHGVDADDAGASVIVGGPQRLHHRPDDRDVVTVDRDRAGVRGHGLAEGLSHVVSDLSALGLRCPIGRRSLDLRGLLPGPAPAPPRTGPNP